MRRKKVVIPALITLILGATLFLPYFPLYFGDRGTIIEDYDLEPSFGDLTFVNPVDIQSVVSSNSQIPIYRVFIVEQRGVIHEILNHNSSNPIKSQFLDIQDRVSFGGEKGLLGLAFDPNFANNGYFYIDFTAPSPLRTVISRFTVDEPLDGLPLINSEKVILEVNQPYENHNAGQIMFGVDNFLYITLGDGGLANDPDENGQNRKTLLGSILRIDVNVSEDSAYIIPEDNPFYHNTDGYREEIYVYGFRNPWRISQDFETGNIYVGDVGQNRIEEIDVITLDDKGKNYGWDKKEGKDCFLSISCDGNFVDPIAQYSHDVGISVTGGYVYRNDELVGLNGFYLYGDYISGKIWALEYDGSKVLTHKFILQYEINISTFGLNWNGDLLVADYSGGIVYKMINVNDKSLI